MSLRKSSQVWMLITVVKEMFPPITDQLTIMVESSRLFLWTEYARKGCGTISTAGTDYKVWDALPVGNLLQKLRPSLTSIGPFLGQLQGQGVARSPKRRQDCGKEAIGSLLYWWFRTRCQLERHRGCSLKRVETVSQRNKRSQTRLSGRTCFSPSCGISLVCFPGNVLLKRSSYIHHYCKSILHIRYYMNINDVRSGPWFIQAHRLCLSKFVLKWFSDPTYGMWGQDFFAGPFDIHNAEDYNDNIIIRNQICFQGHVRGS